ncbi:MAG: hypothetical protein J5854_01115 [Clostridia bacterium]|nr:hypothetical protein [Clostridia bacterium]
MKKYLFKTICLIAALVLILPLLTGCKEMLRNILEPILGSPKETEGIPGASELPAETENVPESTGDHPFFSETPSDTAEPTLPPAPLAYTVGWESPVGTGYMMCGAVSSTGELWVFKDAHGAGINYEVVSQQEPVKIMNGVASVYGAGADLLALKTDGTLWFIAYSSSPAPVMIADGVATADGGGEICAFIRYDGSLFTVKNSDIKSLKQNAPITKMLDSARAVSCGGNFVAAIKTDGTLWTWGNNEHGQLGIGNITYTPEPTRIMDNVKCVDCADKSAVAVTNDGSVFVWGYCGLNTAWQDSYKYYDTPTFAMSGVLSAVCSESYGRTLMILKDTGAVWMWSATPNADGNGYSSNSFLLMDGCKFFCFGGGVLLMLKDDGALWVGGYYSFSQNGKFSVLCGDVSKILDDGYLPEQPAIGLN